MEGLKRTVRDYASQHRNEIGIAHTPVGLRMKCVESPEGYQYAIVRPLVLFVLQGAKRMFVGRQERIVAAGNSTVLSWDTPVATRIEQATPTEPYLAVAIEIEITTLCDVVTHLAPEDAKGRGPYSSQDAEVAVLECVHRLAKLCDHPPAIPLLRPGIMRELHYWLLLGRHSSDLRLLCDPASHANRLAGAIEIIRDEFRTQISSERLAAKAGMGLTAFHRHFKRMLFLSPGQYQKRLRLIEARRLMLDEGTLASAAAFRVGYESVSQFTRDYQRLFGLSPKKDVLRIREELAAAREMGAKASAFK